MKIVSHDSKMWVVEYEQEDRLGASPIYSEGGKLEMRRAGFDHIPTSSPKQLLEDYQLKEIAESIRLFIERTKRFCIQHEDIKLFERILYSNQ